MSSRQADSAETYDEGHRTRISSNVSTDREHEGEMQGRESTEAAERPDTFWRRVYLAVIVVTVVVVTLLWAFSKYFSGK